MLVFRLNRALDIARGAKTFLNPKNGTTSDAATDAGQRKKSEDDKQELARIREELRAAKGRARELRTAKGQAEKIEYKKRKKTVQQEIFRLEMKLRAAKQQQAAEDALDGQPTPQPADELETGALPDFVVIGAKKCGTTSFYSLLTQHPHVEPAAKKELHYFNVIFEEESVEWYRRCFPQPRWQDGRRTITGEGTPGYLSNPLAPERMIKVVPQARLIALLRNPVDRAYSDYHQVVRKGRETRTFEEAIEETIEAGAKWPRAEEYKTSEHEDRTKIDGVRYGYLVRGIYVDQLLRWSKFFSDEQMLVLKSEDFFERPSEALKPVLDFLGLPDWKPETSEVRNKGVYERGMDPATRRRLEEFFEPHNQRLYEYLGTDFGW